MQACVTRTTASVGSRRRESGTDSIRTSPAPCMRVARISLSPFPSFDLDLRASIFAESDLSAEGGRTEWRDQGTVQKLASRLLRRVRDSTNLPSSGYSRLRHETPG